MNIVTNDMGEGSAFLEMSDLMFKQVKYFQAVVKNNSFTEAAEECFISQSAISQQIKALEQELGVELLKRTKRSFTLTPAGEYFYKKSLVWVADFEAIRRETYRIAGNNEEILRLGILKGYSGNEFQNAVAEFSSKFPDVSVEVTHGNHDELYDRLRNSETDIVLNDQRRAFSDEYKNIILDEQEYCIEISSKNPLAELEAVDISDLKNIPCIILSSKEQQETEKKFYADDIGFGSEIIFAENIEDARMLLIQGKGFMTVEGSDRYVQLGNVTKKLRLTRNDNPIIRRYCAFIKVDNPLKHTEEFVELLKKQFVK